MKTIEETIEKWNEICDLVIAGAPDANNTSWQRVKDVFGMKEYPTEVISEFCTAWNKSSEEDTDDDKKAWPLIMKCIDGLLDNSTLYDYAFYLHNGEVGILADVSRDVAKKKGYEEFNGITFVPGYDMEEVIEHKEYTPHQTDDDCYSSYCYGVIGLHECVNPENEEHLIEGWWSDVYAVQDEYIRELTDKGRLANHTSERDSMIDSIVEAIENYDSLDYLKEEWEETVAEYNDPLECDYDVSFAGVVEQALMAADVIEYKGYRRSDYANYGLTFPGIKMTWDEYNNSEQETYLDEENGADTEIVWENNDYQINAFKALDVKEDHFFAGEDEDFAVVSNKADVEYLVYDCTLAELIEYYSRED